MAVTGNEGDVIDVDRLLTAAARAMADARSCWLVTLADNGNFSARPMGRLPQEAGDAEWAIRFITDRRSHKAGQIRGGAVWLTYDNPRARAICWVASGIGRLRDSMR
jgi:hypothetical protein